MKFILLALVLVFALAASLALVTNKKESVTHKMESASVTFNVRDFPEHGIYLIGPFDEGFAKMAAQLNEEASITDLLPYSVFLKNTSSRSVVGIESFGSL